MTGGDFITVADGAYRLELPDAGIVLYVDRLRRRSDELIGELTVTCDLPGARRVNGDGVILAADLNLSSVRARQDRAALLAKRAEAPDLDWYGAVEYLSQQVIQAERTGAPAVLLRDVPRPAPDATVMVHGLPVLRDQPMILFGDGGAGKSLIALAIAGELTRRGLLTLYADWETSAGDHRDRLEALFGADMPGVLYARCEAPLSVEADRLRRLVLAHDVRYVVLDSVAFGCDGPPEAAESAAGYFRALRRLRVGALLVAHVTKAEGGDQRPFGSAFWHNGARSTWFAKRSEADGQGHELTIALFHRKCNTGPLLPARGLRIVFAQGRIHLQPTDLAEHADFGAKLPLWQRAKAAIAERPLTIPELATSLDARLDTVIKMVHRTDRLFIKRNDADGKQRIYLVDRRPA